MNILFSHLSPEYQELKLPLTNGAYWYSKELIESILPKIKTERPFVTINMNGHCADNAIVFIHNNDHPERYEWLRRYKNLILICSKIETLNTIIELLPEAHTIYVPMSIDTTYVKKFKAKRKTKNKCYFGRTATVPKDLPEDVTILGSMDREKALTEVGKYKTVYACGRCLLEAKCLGCKTVNVSRYRGSEELIDNKKIIPILQKFINEIDGV